MISPHASNADAIIYGLMRQAAYSSHGAWLKTVRNRGNGLTHEPITQDQFAKEAERYFRARHINSIDRRAYGSMERNKRVPLFEELEPLFLTFTDWFGTTVSDLECRAYVLLARQRVESRQKKLSSQKELEQYDWDELEIRLLKQIGSKRSKIRLVGQEETSEESREVEAAVEDPNSRRRQELREALSMDTSHLLDRKEWTLSMLGMLQETPQKKLVVIRAGMGAGKTHAQTLLMQELVAQKDQHYYIIPYTFERSSEQGSKKKPEEHLATFLATISSDLTCSTGDEKHYSQEERVKQVLTAIKSRSQQGQKVVVFLDDAQEIFPEASEWDAGWKFFLETFVKEAHTATIYLTTRVWPGWPNRMPPVYVEVGELPDLSAKACITIWHSRGYKDVSDTLLEKISGERCGWNPQAIEILAYQNKQRQLAFGWAKKGEVSSRQAKSPNEQRLEALLNQDLVFDVTERESQRLLQQAITSNLSHQATMMLECLAASPLGLPRSLLGQNFPRAEEAFSDLINASLIDLNAAEAQRAMITPLAREAQIQQLLADGRYEGIEARVTDLYTYWLDTFQEFRDDAEKAALIAEMVCRFIRARQLLKAAELFISFGWLCVTFGHVARIQRVYEGMTKEDRGKEEDVKHEIGRLVLRHHIASRIGQKISGPESEQIYQSIYEKVLAGKISLPAHSEIDVLHNMMLHHLRLRLFREANQMFDETLARIHRSGQETSTEAYASYLHSKSRLFARWSEAEKQEGHLDEAQRLLLACVDILRECALQWKQCLKNAFPIQEHYIIFKLARVLTDYAYRQRLLNHLIEAKEAIEESIRLKRLSVVPAYSLAISLSEYSQILVTQGHIRRALDCNAEAISLMEHAIEDGDSSLDADLGMLLVERADIYQQQARLEEAKQLLERAISLIGDKRSRKSFRLKADNNIKEIRYIEETTRYYQLDQKWFARYHDLASFDDLAWLVHAGPFTQEEEEEWKRLYVRHNEEEVSDRLAELIVQSRRREFKHSQEEHRAPNLFYPMLPIDDIQQRIAGFEQLQKDIDAQENHAAVRTLYAEVINEDLALLRQCAATALRDQDIVWQTHLNLYGKPERQEVMVALQPFCSMLLRAQHHEQAGPLAQELLKRLRQWGLSPEELADLPPLTPKQPEGTKSRANEKQVFSCKIVQRFFQDVFDKEYHAAGWKVAIAPARDHAYVDIDSQTLFLPTHSLKVDQIRELLAEEIETHAYRSMNGQRSSLALLGSGLAKYKATEEGLATHFVQQVERQLYGKTQSKSWISTLCIGLATGVMTPSHSFLELCDFLEKAYLANRLYREMNETQAEMLAAARDEAWTRVARVFRGIPDCNEKGICSLRDRIYLQGYMDVLRYIKRGDHEERLLVGKIKIEDVSAMAELNILTPYYSRQHIAFAPDLIERLSQYK